MKHALLLAFALVSAMALSACGEKRDSVMDQIERGDAEKAKADASQADAASAYLAQQRNRAGVEARTSGLLLEFTGHGRNQSLPHPTPGSVALVNYEGRLVDGTVFDSSFERGAPAQFPVQGLIPGFTEALMQMRPGDEVIATIPPDIGYGTQGQPPSIPGNAVLIFRIQLLGFQTEAGQRVMAPQ